MKKTYDKPEVSIITFEAQQPPVATASATGADGLSVSLNWLLG